MPYDIAFVEMPDMLRVEVSGERNMNDSIDLWKKVSEESKKLGKYRVLAILEVTGSFSVGQVYYLAANYRDYGLTIRHQLAIVDKQVESLSNLEFASVVASNRGLSMRAFSDTGQAIKWLGASSNN